MKNKNPIKPVTIKEISKNSFEGKEYLTNLQTQNFLGISRSGLHKLVRSKKAKQYTINGLERKMFKKSELEKLFTPVK